MKIFQSVELKKANKELTKINLLEDSIKKLSDKELRAKTNEFKDRLSNGETLEDIKIEAFAVIREATWRVLNKRPYDVQILGGLILDSGSVAEMKTGEGKTIASIAPVYLNALSGQGVLVSTVNEYLTERDAEEVGQVHQWMGLTVGVNKRDISEDQKREAYMADITYSVHSEIGFDYLRDNMVDKIEKKTQRGFNFALIDEVDSILIDEARTPLIITGGSAMPPAIYNAAQAFASTLKKDDYNIDLESKTIQLSEEGIDKANKFFGVENIFMMQNSDLVHRIQNALVANYIMHRDADYIVNDGKILIVDAFTGRVMEGRSFSDGMHQAIQAKEKVEIEPETKTMATITYQNLFRMFKKLSGMTGTGKTEEDEFMNIYNMRVHVIPTNKPIQRIDHDDLVFNSLESKYKAAVEDIKQRYEKGQPVLVGTEEVSESEKLSEMLKKANIPHTVLNAKQNQNEADIIAKAGIEKSITIATNMAGRGTDIKPTPGALKNGGLYVLGTNKAEARRIDNQLKGRSGRQGDVGESRFYLSIEDKLIKRFTGQPALVKKFASHGDKPIKSSLLVKKLDAAQKKIEGMNYDARKDVLQYDDVIRQQRDLIYAQRDIVIGEADLKIVISRMFKSVVRDLITDKLFKSLRNQDGQLNEDKTVMILNKVWFSLTNNKLTLEELKGKTNDEMIEEITKIALFAYDEIRENVTENTSDDTMHALERGIVLRAFDENWQQHIDKMTKLKTNSKMASYAQKNPFQVYVEQGAELFQDMLKRISHNTIKLIMSNQYAIKQEAPEDNYIKNQIIAAMNKENKGK